MDNLNVKDNVTPIIDAARESVDIEKRVSAIRMDDAQAGLFVRLDQNGSPCYAADIQSALEQRLPSPRRRSARLAVTELDSFIDAVNRWKLADRTTIWAETSRPLLVAVIDDNPKGQEGAGWRSEFTLTYQPPHSPEWKRWTACSGKELSQDEFAQFLDDNLADVTTIPSAAKGEYPSPVELLEMARNLSIHTNGSFERLIDPTNGTGKLVIKDEHAAYSTKIWKHFPLALRVFDGGKHYHVDARIRFRLVNGKALFTYSLHLADEIARTAFQEIRAVVAEKCEGVPIFAGTSGV